MGRAGVSAVRGQLPRPTAYREGGRPVSEGPPRLTARLARGCADALAGVFELEAVPLVLLAFLIGRATVLQSITPFGLALFAAVISLGPRRGLAVALAAAGGTLSVGAAEPALEFLGAAAGLGLLVAAFTRQGRAPGSVTLAALTFTVTVVAGAVAAAISDPTPYQFLMAFFSALISFALTLVYLAALPPIIAHRRPVALGPDQVAAVAIAVATAVAGLVGLDFGGLRLAGLASGVLVLLGAGIGGAGVGAMTGTVTGVVSALCQAGGLPGVALQAFGGLLGGSFRDFGRAGTAVGYFLGVLLLSPLVDGAVYLRGVVIESALAAIIMILIPGRWLSGLRSAIETVASGLSPGTFDRMAHEQMGRRLADLGEVFGQLATTLREVSASAGAGIASPTSEAALPSGLAEAACRVCQSCRLFRTCWHGDLGRTRDAMTSLLEVTTERGQLEARDIPVHLRRRCVHLGELVTTMNFLYEISALNRHWRKRLDESRTVVHKQLDGISAILRSLGERLEHEVTGDAETAAELCGRLRRAGFPALAVTVEPVADGKSEYVVRADTCVSADACREQALAVASSLLGQPLVVGDVECGLADGSPECSFRLAIPRRLDFRVGVAQARKAPGGVSGDSYLIRELPGSRLAVVLSDGTGAGPRAASESQATVHMLEELFKMGFETDMTVRTVNSMLLLRSANERFSTLDLLTVDLHDGQGRFIKVGAPPSYLRRGREVSVIHSANLPLGVLPEVSTEGHLCTFRAGDLIVLATDGLLSAAPDRSGPGARGDSWVVELLRDVGEASPQEVADALVEASMSLSQKRLPAVAGGPVSYPLSRGGLSDDITIMALRFSPRELA